jgi:hypothetical protein
VLGTGAASSRSASRLSADDWDPLTSVTSWPSGPSSAVSVAACWRASRSVGASSAAWPPVSATNAMAAAATAVLPEPTSPCNSRSIGRAFARSDRTAASALIWSGVSRIEPASQASPACCLRAAIVPSMVASTELTACS